MPSPFPGMDPYLEGSLWSSVHSALSNRIARQLSPKLRPKYVALTEKRFVTDMYDPEEDVAIHTVREGSAVYPDAGIVVTTGRAGTSAAATLEPPLRMQTVMPESVPVHTVEIRDVEQRRLVTAIEILSPVNKRGDGRREYLDRRRKFLISSSHLIEIDLLRGGHRVPMTEPLPQSPYFAFVSRAQRRPTTEVWPVQMDSRLPKIPVPLLPGDADVELDLQTAVSAIYDEVGYDLLIDYSKPPEVQLDPAEWEWAQHRIAEWKAINPQ